MSEKGGIDLNNIILIGALIGGGYLVIKYLLPALKDLSNIPAAVASGAANVVSGGIITPGVQTAQDIVGGGAALVNLPANVVTQNVPGLAQNAVSLLSGMKAVPILGAMLDQPIINAAVSGLSQTAKGTLVSSNQAVPGLISSSRSKGPFITYTGAPQIISGTTSFTGLRSNVSLNTRGR